ncbi:L,D-transpeptidase [Gaetbulibacter aestuarii]|uniref:L,D-transpeptidase n=1 Tax=Gaetbulibacter aestuarii TaxID=1502358 RepID=A0ABW7MXI0_9FLAO
MNLFRIISYYLVLFVLFFVGNQESEDRFLALNSNTDTYQKISNIAVLNIEPNSNIRVEHYFEFMDSIVKKYDSITPYKLSEHLIVRYNPWILDTLQNTDYYKLKARNSFVYDQRKMIVIPKGARIRIPDLNEATTLQNSFKKLKIDINIPEFKLRIYQDTLKLFEFDIRVGRHEKKYLEMSGRIEDLRTRTGSGIIVNEIKSPRYINPVNNEEYFVTKRDDGLVTKLPQIPFLETEINGRRYGQLIHPTTNPITLGKAYSNGCIGTREADAWVIYYYAPLKTKINIRYDLDVVDEQGNQRHLNDIYGYRSLDSKK